MILFSLLKDAEMVKNESQMFWYQFWDCLNLQVGLECTQERPWGAEWEWGVKSPRCVVRPWDVVSWSTDLLAVSFLWRLFVTPSLSLSLSLFGNKGRTTNVCSVLLSSECFFCCWKKWYYKVFLTLWILQKKCCKYNSINYIETIKKERIKMTNIFVRELVAGSARLGRGERRSLGEWVGSWASSCWPPQAVRTLFSSFRLCVRPKKCIRVIPAY